MTAKVCWLLASAVACVIAVSGILKLADLPGFSQALSTWTVLPGPVKSIVLVCLPILEVAAGIGFLFFGRSKAVFIGMFVFLVMASAAYVTQLLTGEAPKCGCLGLLSEYVYQRETAKAVLFRDGVLLLCSALALVLWPRRKLDPASAGRATVAPTLPPVESPANGFTLIEMLVSIAIVAILLALVVPSLMPMRAAARDTKRLAQLRSHGTVFASYANDFRELFPAITEPKSTATVYRFQGRAFYVPYFGACWAWNLALAPSYYGDNPWDASFTPPGQKPQVFSQYYWYASSFLTDPKFWDPYERLGPSQWRSTRLNEVTFPQKKALITNEGEIGFLEGRGINKSERSAAFVDGHAAKTAPENMVTPYPNGLGDWFDCTSEKEVFGLYTLYGVKGQDVR
ncbi:MAG: type II secretion system protein [Phycisphaeraceae bacterium]|nr:type II secretion system protein [Phycisphaeraceae bacterium]